MNDDNLEFFAPRKIAMNFAELGALTLKDFSVTQTNPLTKKYTKENIATYLASPSRYSNDLVGMSQVLYQSSPHYRKIVRYLATLPTIDYIIEPYGLNLEKINEKSFRTGYQRANELIELMNIKHEMKKILITCWIEDAFYGYEHIGKDSYFIQKLPAELCQVSSIEDGVYNFAFKFSWFDRNLDKLDTYPKEFKKLYNKYLNGSAPEWQELDPKSTICIKVNEEIEYAIPPMVGIFRSIFDIEDYKALKKTKEVIGNYKFFVQKIPIRDKSDRNNDFMIDLNHVSLFHNKTMQTLPEEIGLITSPMDIEPINFTDNKTERNAVDDAERELFNSAGISQLLFNGDGSSSANLAKSIGVDEQDAFALLRQIERWINRKMKSEVKGAYKFRAKLLDVTNHNKIDYATNMLTQAQYGLPVKLILCSVLGLTPSAVTSLAYLENTILGLVDQFIPLSSSHTQTAEGTEGAEDTPDGESGRPEKKEDELSEKGEEQRDRGDNDNRE